MLYTRFSLGVWFALVFVPVQKPARMGQTAPTSFLTLQVWPLRLSVWRAGTEAASAQLFNQNRVPIKGPTDSHLQNSPAELSDVLIMLLNVTLRYATLRYIMLRYVRCVRYVRYVTVCNVIRCNTTRYDTTRYDMT